MKKITARFIPQVLVQGVVHPADPQGLQYFDVTQPVLAMTAGAIGELDDDSYESDTLAQYGPQWVKDWVENNPYAIRIEESLDEFFAQFDLNYATLTDAELDVVRQLVVQQSGESEQHEYLFDLKLFASIRVKAATPEEARKLLLEHLECANINAGAWPNGDPITGEVSPDGEVDLIEVDGEDAT
jgi:hypothetical protein